MTYHLLQLHNLPILEQLHLEEALLRADDRNWILINKGSTPAVVMGISGKPDQLLHNRSLPLIKRFSGSGTVVVDEQTIFVTLLGNKSSLPCEPFPEKLMRWTEKFYSPLGISLRDNDYVIGDRKCGGNAQYIQKDRWLHHTSFLWDYDPTRMACLKQPPRQPDYRNNRTHAEVLTPLKRHFPSSDKFLSDLMAQLGAALDVTPANWDDAALALARAHRRTTVVVRGS